MFCPLDKGFAVAAGCTVVELGMAEVTADGTDAAEESAEDGATVVLACGTTTGFAAGRATSAAGACIPRIEGPNCIHAAYPPAAISRTAATASKAFLLPPPSDFSSLSIAPPKVNEGAGEVCSTVELLALIAAFSNGIWSSGIAAGALASAELVVFATRAGAAALAEPADGPTENPAVFVVGAATSGVLRAISGSGSVAAGGAIFAALVCAFDVVIDGDGTCFGTAFPSSPDSATSLVWLELVWLEAVAAKLV
jgi:hypothetical protein